MKPWSLTTALAVVEPDVWSTTPFAAVGLALPAADGGVRFEMRTRQVATANEVRPADMPPALRAPATGITASRLTVDADTSRPIDRVMSFGSLDSVVTMPLGPGHPAATMFAAMSEERPFTDDEIGAVAAFARRVDQLAAAGEPLDVRERRLLRYDALSTVLSALGTALDIRDIFGRLSTLTRAILPHDTAVVGMFEGDGSTIRPYALSAPDGWTMPAVMTSPYPNALHSTWEFALHHDLAANPIERNWPMARLGMRSAMRLPIRIDGRNAGVLTFNSYAPNLYTQADVIVARRVADYVTLALSHQRLADDARDGAAVHARAANLEMLDGLLKTLATVLDIREVFDRISQISEKVMNHDAMSITRPSADGRRITVHVTTGVLAHVQTPYEMPNPMSGLRERPWEFVLVDDLHSEPGFADTPSARSGLTSMLSLPIPDEGQFPAAVNFFSRARGAFTRDDVLVGRRIADHVALALSHERLAAAERRTVHLQARAANLELLDQVLATIGDTADLGGIFEKISGTANRVLPHDALLLPVLLPDGERARIYACAGMPLTVPEIAAVPPEYIGNDDWEYDLFGDIQAETTRRNALAVRFGYRSALRVPIRLERKFVAALSFLAFEPNRFSVQDVPVARRIADRVALLLARDRGAAAARRADEASARALQLEARVRELTDELDARTGYRRVIGASAPWRQVLTQATQVAATDTTVLLLGESGTGKEVIARFLHRASSRPNGPFVALNCAALPEQLLEAELFGYERGAFTGATQSKPGQLEQASGGTLFLDEVGEMSLPAQAKFLRVLQEREFQRLGGTRVLKSNARIIAATNRDLQKAIAQGGFREDLYYRLNVFAIPLPALRDRSDDVLPLADAFLAEYGGTLGRPPAGISRDARERLRGYHWPGNVRELRNTLERAAILCEGGLITSEHLSLLPAPTRRAPVEPLLPATAGHPAEHPLREPAAPARPASAGDLQTMERTLVEQALQEARFNKSKAAKTLGITRAQLYVRMRRHGLE
jgi:transcriptional regulator with GAF, ATPase, and Fis domain